jgi:hypothetical protein
MSILTVDQLTPDLKELYDSLPDDLRPYLLSLPPRITMKRTTQFMGCSRGYVYDQAAKRHIDIFKAGPAQNSLIVVGTVSILKLMAGMTRAAIKPRRPSKPAEECSAESRLVGRAHKPPPIAGPAPAIASPALPRDQALNQNMEAAE